MSKEVKIDGRDLWSLLLSSLRYSMGRRSYMPSYLSDMVKNYSKHLDYYQLKQIMEEVLDNLRLEKTHKGYLGMDCDVETWRNLSDWLELELDRRSNFKEDNQRL